MSRYDHFRRWLTEQSPRPTASAPSVARAQYTLPEYRLPPKNLPPRRPVIPPPIWVDPQGMLPPVFSQESSPHPLPSTTGASLPELPSPPRAIAPVPSTTAFYGASFTNSAPHLNSRPVRPETAQDTYSSPTPASPPSPTKSFPKLYSYALVVFVWLGLLGLGGYAVTRLLDPLFAKHQPEVALQPSPQRSDPNELALNPTQDVPQSSTLSPNNRLPSTPLGAETSSVPSTFDYADVSPRSSNSPIWALVAVITASALGSRLLGHHSRPSRNR